MNAGAVPDEYLIEPEMLLQAYSVGVFPMAEKADDLEIFWVRPEKRGIIPLDDFHIPKSLQKTIRQGVFDIRLDSDFAGVIEGCASGSGERAQTWINAPIREAYAKLFAIGHCHTVEAWHEDKLVGGLYGVTLGRAFFGESMFTRKRDASKACLAYLVSHLKKQNFVLLDTQFTTPHLERFGAIEVPREKYEMLLERALNGEGQF